ncbi:MAG: D-xylose transporter XylE [Bacteroidales bacterium]
MINVISHYKGRIIRLSLIATIGGLLFGYDTAVVSGTVDSLQHFFINRLHLSADGASSVLGFTVSSALIGCIIGSLFSGMINNRLGRKKTMMLAAVFFLISAIGSAMPEMVFGHIGDQTTNFLPAFITYRIIGGIGVGLASMTCPVYIAEIVPPNIRGRLVALNQFAIVLGILISYLANYYISLGATDRWLNLVGWRYMFGVEAIPAILFLFFLLFVPESPYWHLLKNKDQKARKTLFYLSPVEIAEKHMSEIKETLHHTSSKILSYGWPVLIVGFLINAFQQFTGINIVLYYAPDIFKTLGNSFQSALLQTGLIGVVNILFTVVSMYTVDSLGRKALLVIGSSVMSLSLIILGFVFYFHVGGVFPLLMVIIFIAAFAVSWGPVAWVVNSEIFPSKIRNKALAVCIAVQWAFNYIVSSTFPLLNEDAHLTKLFHHGFSFWLYGILTLVSLFFVIFMLPETRKKSLEDIEHLWLRRMKKKK